MDDDLARLAHSSGRLRHAVGTGLEALVRVGGHHDLGFSSVEAYALERCERRARWIQQSRGLARRLARLPVLRCALETGAIGFSMAQLLAKVAEPDDEARWLSEARTRTVRQMRALVARTADGTDGTDAPGDENRRRETAPDEDGGDGGCSTAGEPCTLTVTVDQEDAWLLECARTLAAHVAGPTTEDTMEALLGEGTTSLLAAVDARRRGGGADLWLCEDEPVDDAQRAWEAQRARWRDEAEQRCEKNFVGRAPQQVPCATDVVASTPASTFDGDATAIDAELRRVAEELAVRELELGRLAEAFWKADGWRRLGYATDTQYARERLGMSLSSLKAKRTLARRVVSLPGLDGAIRGRVLGYEAACLVASVATPETERAWIDRARERTLKHFREEVSAVQMLARLGAKVPRPPTDATGRGATSADEPDVCATDATDGTDATPGDEPDVCATEACPPPRRGRGRERDASPDALWPPSDDLMREVAAFESHIASGAVFSEPGESDGQGTSGPMSAGPGDDPRDDPGGDEATRLAKAPGPSHRLASSCLGRLSAAVVGLLDRVEGRTETMREVPEVAGDRVAPRPPPKDRGRARVTVRLRVSAGMRRYYRQVERLFLRQGPRRVSFLRFLCASLVETWRHALGPDVAYAHVYARDRYRCTSPVCMRRDVTPHHLTFRAAGGDEAPRNLTSLCVHCHLEGIHGGRLRAMPPADHARWTLGQRGHEHTVVHGRRRERVGERAPFA